MLIIGEKLNGFIPAVKTAINGRDEAYLKNLAIAQERSGADYLDICAAVDNDAEVETLEWLIRLAEGSSSLPVCIDSANPDAIAAVLPQCKRTGIVNSVSMESGKVETIFPLIADTGWKCIALLCSNSGIPDSVGDRIRIFEDILEQAKAYGISEDRLLIDPIVRTLSTDETALTTFAACTREIRARSKDVRVVSGLSNISYGLPARTLINHAFLILAMQSGMDSAILDPTDREMIGLMHAAQSLLGEDEYCMDYISAFRENRIGPLKND